MRENKMLVVKVGIDGSPLVWCDPEIFDIVKALSDGGVKTVASCSGHGYRPGSIALSDGRWIVIAKDKSEFDFIESFFPYDINGESVKFEV